MYRWIFHEIKHPAIGDHRTHPQMAAHGRHREVMVMPQQAQAIGSDGPGAPGFGSEVVKACEITILREETSLFKTAMTWGF